MSGHHSFSKLRAGLSEERQKQIAQKTAKLRQEIALRQARNMTQIALGEILSIEQPVIANMEKHTDMYLSHFRRFIEAQGGTLSITAHFPEGDVEITTFANAA